MTCKPVLPVQEYKIHNAEVLFREDASVDDLIDVIEGNRKYTRCLYVYNKVRFTAALERLASQPSVCLVRQQAPAGFRCLLHDLSVNTVLEHACRLSLHTAAHT